MKIYFIAGEKSGDFIGGRIIEALRSLASESNILGVGGARMIGAGLKSSLFPMEKISLFGLFEILPHLLGLKRLIKLTVKDILEIQPDVLVTIDSPGFCFRVVEQIKKLAPHIVRIHVVAPSVWAYKPERAIKVAALYNHLLTLLPFDAPLFEKYGLRVTYIGHPIFEQPFGDVAIDSFKEEHNIKGQAIALTPGSRLGEIKRHLPIFVEAVRKSCSDDLCIIVVSDNPSHHGLIHKVMKRYGINYLITSDKLSAFKAADLTLAKSGTNTLEVAACGSAMIVSYKLNPLTWWFLKKLINIKYASLINIIAGQEIIPELLQKECNPDNLACYISDLLHDQNKSTQQKNQSLKILEQMGFGAKIQPSMIAAKAILASMIKSSAY